MKTLNLAARSVAPLVIGGLLFGMLGFTLSPAWSMILMAAGINVILAVSLNVVNGFTGQFSIGHAGFAAVGAYTCAKITLAIGSEPIWGLPETLSASLVFLFALAMGMLMAAVVGFLVGTPSLRLRGDYLAIVTLGFNEIIRVLIENSSFLGAATGLSGLPRRTNIVWVGMGLIATILMARRLIGSTHGRALLSIREDEVAAEAMGVNTTSYKVKAFVIASAFAGLGGGLLVHMIQLCSPRSFGWIKSFEVVAMVVLGGMGSVSGSVVAALVLSLLQEILREAQQYRMAIYAILLIALMLTRPSGIFGTRELWDMSLPKWLRRRSAQGGTP